MDEWQLRAINLRSITRFLLPSLYLLVAGILIFWPKTFPKTYQDDTAQVFQSQSPVIFTTVWKQAPCKAAEGPQQDRHLAKSQVAAQKDTVQWNPA